MSEGKLDASGREWAGGGSLLIFSQWVEILENMQKPTELDPTQQSSVVAVKWVLVLRLSAR